MIEAKLPSFSINQNEKQSFEFASRRNSQFTDKIHSHGFMPDKSIEGATRQLKRQDLMLQRKKQSMDKLCNAFSAEVEDVKRLQQKLFKKQKMMAQLAVEKYAVISIQAAYRGHRARSMHHMVMSYRKIRRWFKRRLLLKERAKAGRTILNHYKNFRFRYLWASFVRIAKSGRFLCNRIRGSIMLKRSRIRMYVMKQTRVTVSHCLLHGVGRANRFLKPRTSLMDNHLLNRLVVIFRRNARLRLLRGPYGKVVYLTLQQACKEHNPIGGSISMFSLIKLKVDQATSAGRAGLNSARLSKGRSSPSAGASRLLGNLLVNHRGARSPRKEDRKTTTEAMPSSRTDKLEQILAAAVASMRIDWPKEFGGLGAPMSISALMDMFRDFVTVAVENPSLVDGKPPIQIVNYVKTLQEDIVRYHLSMKTEIDGPEMDTEEANVKFSILKSDFSFTVPTRKFTPAKRLRTPVTAAGTAPPDVLDTAVMTGSVLTPPTSSTGRPQLSRQTSDVSGGGRSAVGSPPPTATAKRTVGTAEARSHSIPEKDRPNSRPVNNADKKPTAAGSSTSSNSRPGSKTSSRPGGNSAGAPTTNTTAPANKLSAPANKTSIPSGRNGNHPSIPTGKSLRDDKMSASEKALPNKVPPSNKSATADSNSYRSEKNSTTSAAAVEPRPPSGPANSRTKPEGLVRRVSIRDV